MFLRFDLIHLHSFGFDKMINVRLCKQDLSLASFMQQLDHVMVSDLFAPDNAPAPPLDTGGQKDVHFHKPGAPCTFLEGVLEGFRGSKYLLRRYLEPYNGYRL